MPAADAGGVRARPQPGPFVTPRLRAAPLSPDDLDELVSLYLDEDVSRFLGGTRSRETTAAYLETNLRHWAKHGFGLWVFRAPDGAFVSRAGLRYVELEGASELEIAYALARPAWGQGLATEIAQALLSRWDADPVGPSVVGVVSVGNAASEHVLRKTGFIYERDALWHGEAVKVLRRRRAENPENLEESID